MTVGMKWWETVMFPVRRVCVAFSKRLRIRNSGLLKLHHDVRACEYEDVRVMWEMLKRNEMEVARSPTKSKKKPYWNFFEWARRVPYICHGV